ncbi:hypothetical protein [Enterobacter quasiroggenkampii]|uniref:hypothetical protein n=1 Tax=Enterobacter quasiroggenkampii TaxID=2497436 RepID=UPI003AAF7722
MKLRDSEEKCQAGIREDMDYFAMASRSVMDITISTNAEIAPFFINYLIFKK